MIPNSRNQHHQLIENVSFATTKKKGDTFLSRVSETSKNTKQNDRQNSFGTPTCARREDNTERGPRLPPFDAGGAGVSCAQANSQVYQTFDVGCFVRRMKVIAATARANQTHGHGG